MATKSFTTDFRVNKKTSDKIASSVASSRRVDHNINRRVETIRDKEKIAKIMSNLFVEK